jgi:hypothetical protein
MVPLMAPQEPAVLLLEAPETSSPPLILNAETTSFVLENINVISDLVELVNSGWRRDTLINYVLQQTWARIPSLEQLPNNMVLKPLLQSIDDELFQEVFATNALLVRSAIDFFRDKSINLQPYTEGGDI